MKKLIGTSVFAVCAMALAASSAQAATVIKPYYAVKQPGVSLGIDKQVGLGDAVDGAAPSFFAPTSGTQLISSFEGTSDYDTRALGIGLIPPDTNGAVGTTQFVEIINGSFSVYNKLTGALAAPRITDRAFWLAAGGTATGGDPRLLFDNRSNRWLAVGFNAGGNGLQIAVSDTDDALGIWRAGQFGAFTSGFQPIADYPTLSLSGNSILVGTNNFSAATSGGVRNFQGTTLNVLNRDAIFDVAGPNTAAAKQFITAFTPTSDDRGFAIQGVNRSGGSSTADLVAVSLNVFDQVTYSVTDAGTASSAQTAVQFTGATAYDSPSAARQPTINASARVVAAGDERIGSSVWEVNGRIYFTQTVKLIGADHDVVRLTVLDATTKAILSETNIGQSPSNAFDYYYGSLAVNVSGQVVVGYNRSGDISTGGDGKISIFARSFNTNANGTLTATSDEILIKQSLVSDYHNGSAEGAAPVGRQRFGDYSAVTVDPTNSQRFWVIGEFAREYNNAGGGHPGGSGFGRWGTFVGQIGIAGVPEPANWAMMIAGFGMAGAAMRRRRTTVRFQTA